MKSRRLVISGTDLVSNLSTKSRVAGIGQVSNTASEIADIVDAGLIGKGVGSGKGDGLGSKGRVELVQEAQSNSILEAS